MNNASNSPGRVPGYLFGIVLGWIGVSLMSVSLGYFINWWLLLAVPLWPLLVLKYIGGRAGLWRRLGVDSRPGHPQR